MNNESATVHMLTPEEALFMKEHIGPYIDKVTQIKKDCNLTGLWAVSQDYKFLVKQGE